MNEAGSSTPASAKQPELTGGMPNEEDSWREVAPGKRALKRKASTRPVATESVGLNRVICYGICILTRSGIGIYKGQWAGTCGSYHRKEHSTLVSGKAKAVQRCRKGEFAAGERVDTNRFETETLVGARLQVVALP